MNINRPVDDKSIFSRVMRGVDQLSDANLFELDNALARSLQSDPLNEDLEFSPFSSQSIIQKFPYDLNQLISEYILLTLEGASELADIDEAKTVLPHGTTSASIRGLLTGPGFGDKFESNPQAIGGVIVFRMRN